jgi:hypothetical protein
LGGVFGKALRNEFHTRAEEVEEQDGAEDVAVDVDSEGDQNQDQEDQEGVEAATVDVETAEEIPS